MNSRAALRSSVLKGHIRIRVAAVLFKGDTVLLVKHRKNGKEYWLLPGGGVEYGETLTQALVREVREETGICVRVGRMLRISDAIPGDARRHIVNLCFLVRPCGGRLKQVREQVLQEARYWPVKQLRTLKIYPSFLERFLLQLVRSKGKIMAPLYSGNTWID